MDGDGGGDDGAHEEKIVEFNRKAAQTTVRFRWKGDEDTGTERRALVMFQEDTKDGFFKAIEVIPHAASLPPLEKI